jgi:plasmid maintenance system killer protein
LQISEGFRHAGSDSTLVFLNGDQAGRRSIRVNDPCRITFRWENGNAYEVRVEGYH